jgi:hypothetical protein
MEPNKENIDFIRSNSSTDVVVNNSNMPVIRAGYGNIIILIAFCITLLVNEVFFALGASQVTRYLIVCALILLFFVAYSLSVSRINFNEDVAEIICSFRRYSIRYSNLSHVNIYIIPSCMFTIMVLRFKKRHFCVFHYVAVSTNRGSAHDSARYLRQMIENKITKGRLQVG